VIGNKQSEHKNGGIETNLAAGLSRSSTAPRPEGSGYFVSLGFDQVVLLPRGLASEKWRGFLELKGNRNVEAEEFYEGI
jgi:hypothetical protein